MAAKSPSWISKVWGRGLSYLERPRIEPENFCTRSAESRLFHTPNKGHTSTRQHSINAWKPALKLPRRSLRLRLPWGAWLSLLHKGPLASPSLPLFLWKCNYGPAHFLPCCLYGLAKHMKTIIFILLQNQNFLDSFGLTGQGQAFSWAVLHNLLVFLKLCKVF